MDPTSTDYAMTYIYDSFEWEHCGDSDAKSVKAMALSLAEDKRRRRAQRALRGKEVEGSPRKL